MNPTKCFPRTTHPNLMTASEDYLKSIIRDFLKRRSKPIDSDQETAVENLLPLVKIILDELAK